MKTRTALALFVAAVLVVGFGAWQGYAWITTETTPKERPTTSAPYTLDAACQVFFDSFLEYGSRTVLGAAPAGWIQTQVLSCVDFEGTFNMGSVHVDLSNVTERCGAWNLGQIKAASAVASKGLPGVSATPCT